MKASQSDQGKDEEKDTPKEEEQQVVQALVNLPSSGTPTKILQEPSIATIPLLISRLGSGSSKVAKIIHYGDAFIDEEIVIPTTMTLEDIGMMQGALEKKKQQEILRK